MVSYALSPLIPENVFSISPTPHVAKHSPFSDCISPHSYFFSYSFQQNFVPPLPLKRSSASLCADSSTQTLRPSIAQSLCKKVSVRLSLQKQRELLPTFLNAYKNALRQGEMKIIEPVCTSIVTSAFYVFQRDASELTVKKVSQAAQQKPRKKTLSASQKKW